MTYFLNIYNSARYGTLELIGPQTDVRVVIELLRQRLPDLLSHLTKLGVHIDYFIAEWLMSLFTVFSVQLCCRIWDMFFFERQEVLILKKLILVQ